MMDAAAFRTLVEAYGSDPRLWPQDRRAGADAFRAAEPAQAEAILGEALALDELLDVLRPPVPSAELRARILQAAPKARSGGAPGRLFGWLRPSVGALMAASCVAGVAAGLLLVEPTERRNNDATVMAVLSSPGDPAADEDNEAVG